MRFCKLFCTSFIVCYSFIFYTYAAERIISLAPHTTELAYAAGLGNKLIAVSEWSNYPEQAKKLEKVASWQGINLERIIALKPDLILAWRGSNPQRVLEQLTGLGIPVFYSDPLSINDIANEIIALGHYADDPFQAENFANQLLQQAAQLRQRYQKIHPIKVMLQVSNHPIIVASNLTLQNEVLQICGAENIFSASSVAWPQVSREQVINMRPQAIIIGGTATQIDNVNQFWQPLLEIPIIAIPEDWLYRSGPRIILAAETLCRQLVLTFPFIMESK